MFSNESLIYDEVFFFIKKRSLIQFIFITSGLPLFTGLLFMVLDYIYNSELTIAIIIGIILMGWIFDYMHAMGRHPCAEVA